MKIQSLPPESIAHVFAHLIPDDLIKSTLVCQHWSVEILISHSFFNLIPSTHLVLLFSNKQIKKRYHLIQDDTCWQVSIRSILYPIT